MEKLLLCLVLLLLITKPTFQQTAANAEEEEFHEELYIKPLPSGHINAYFQFTTRWHYGERKNLHNTHLIPRPIAEILLHYDVKELHVSLTQGLWRYESWGYPVVDTPSGAEFWAWFGSKNLTQAAVDKQWTELAGTFSGILCSSLNFIDATNTLEPKYGFRPRYGGSTWQQQKHMQQNAYVRYATLPREIVCTENLTPWKKLLPCNSKHGFASLLNARYVHNTNFHGLSISMRSICASGDANNCLLELSESANFVFDNKIISSGSANDFSLRRLFGGGLHGRCALAKSSKIYVDMQGSQPYELTPPPHQFVYSTRGGSSTQFGVYNMQLESLAGEQLFNIAWVKQKKQAQAVQIVTPPPIYAHRYVQGYGQERGQIVTRITNTQHTALPIVFQEHIPWYVPCYMHTLKLLATPLKGSPIVRQLQPQRMHYISGEQRVRPYHLEFAFELPARSSVQISFDFDYIFLKWLEYPPDANHGHYLGAAVISTQLPLALNYTAVPVEGYLFAHGFNASRPAYFLELRTETLILSLPTPDFSMPYNVICLACTVVALAFGPIHSVATKKIVIETKDEPQSVLGKLKHKIFGKRAEKKLNENELENLAAETFNGLEDVKYYKIKPGKMEEIETESQPSLSSGAALREMSE